MKLPRDVSGLELAKLLRKFGYKITRQTRKPISKVSITISKHRNLKPGTLNAISKNVADHLGMDNNSLIRELFG